MKNTGMKTSSEYSFGYFSAIFTSNTNRYPNLYISINCRAKMIGNSLLLSSTSKAQYSFSFNAFP